MVRFRDLHSPRSRPALVNPESCSVVVVDDGVGALRVRGACPSCSLGPVGGECVVESLGFFSGRLGRPTAIRCVPYSSRFSRTSALQFGPRPDVRTAIAVAGLQHPPTDRDLLAEPATAPAPGAAAPPARRSAARSPWTRACRPRIHERRVAEDCAGPPGWARRQRQRRVSHHRMIRVTAPLPSLFAAPWRNWIWRSCPWLPSHLRRRQLASLSRLPRRAQCFGPRFALLSSNGVPLVFGVLEHRAGSPPNTVA